MREMQISFLLHWHFTELIHISTIEEEVLNWVQTYEPWMMLSSASTFRTPSVRLSVGWKLFTLTTVLLSLSFFSSHGLKHGICPCNEGRRSNSMYELFDAPCLSLLQTDGLELNPRSTSMLRPCESVHGLNAGWRTWRADTFSIRLKDKCCPLTLKLSGFVALGSNKVREGHSSRNNWTVNGYFFRMNSRVLWQGLWRANVTVVQMNILLVQHHTWPWGVQCWSCKREILDFTLEKHF